MDVLIVGGGGNIGFEFCRQYMLQGHVVTGTFRQIRDQIRLKQLGVTAKKFDLNDLDSYNHLEKYDVIVIAAGTTLNTANTSTTISTDIVGIINTKNLLGNLNHNGTMLFVSSMWGSIEASRKGFHASEELLYKVCQSAKNMVMANLAGKHHKFRFLSIDAGRGVGPRDSCQTITPVEDSVRSMLQIIDQSEKYVSGTFLDYQENLLEF